MAIHMPSSNRKIVKSISFVDEPKVFSYLDETSASQENWKGQWQEGYCITFGEYQQMALKSLEEASQQFIELSKWRQQAQLSTT